MSRNRILRIIAAIAVILTVLTSVFIWYNQINQPKLKIIGSEWLYQKGDGVNILLDKKTNELYIENANGTDRHKWLNDDGTVKKWQE